MQIDIVGIITRIEGERKAKGLYPLHPTFLDIKSVLKMQDSDLMEEINRLKAQGKVKTGNTINSIYVELV